MSKAVMLSIRPKWCEKIVRGEKTIEVRKTRPKMDTPFKCYISGLKIYDVPKKLNEFSPVCRHKNDDKSCPSRRIACWYQKDVYNPDGSINLVECGKTLERPPQSWCYVEAMEEGETE